MPRFVLLYHEFPAGHPRPSHVDLMLEGEGILRTWAIAKLPYSWEVVARAAGELSSAESDMVVTEQLADHRLDFLTYEGPVSDHRGHVARLDTGTFETIRESPHEWIVELAGTHVRGQLTLQHDAETGSNWLLKFQNRELRSL
jgi:hypothetical protein